MKSPDRQLKYRKPVILIAVVAALLALAVLTPFENYVISLQAWTETHPSRALFVVTVFIALSFIALLPASVPMMLAGLLFGLAKGMAVAWVAGLLASTAAFLLARTLARSWIERAIRRQGLFIAIDRAVERKGFTIVLLLRLALLPFPWMNYALGLTSVSLRDYVAGSNIGMLLPYFIFVYLGTTVDNVTALLAGNIHLEREQLITGALLLMGGAALVLLVLRRASRVLREELARAGKAPGSSPG